MPDVNMPKLSDTMEEGTVLEWKKKDGDEVSKGEVLAEIESDKASFEIEAESDGVLHIVVDKGSPVPVGQQIATIGGEAPAAKESAPQAEKPAEEPAARAQEEPKEEPPAGEETEAGAPAQAAEAEEKAVEEPQEERQEEPQEGSQT